MDSPWLSDACRLEMLLEIMLDGCDDTDTRLTEVHVHSLSIDLAAMGIDIVIYRKIMVRISQCLHMDVLKINDVIPTLSPMQSLQEIAASCATKGRILVLFLYLQG